MIRRLPADRPFARYDVSASGLVYAYARPFLAPEGLASLTYECSLRFPSTGLAATHAELLAARDIILDHYTLDQRPVISITREHTTSASRSQITIDPIPGRTPPTSAATLPAGSQEAWSQVIELCEFHLARLTAELHQAQQGIPIAFPPHNNPATHPVAEDGC